MIWVYVVENKDEVFESLKNWKTLVGIQNGANVKALRIVFDLEYCNAVLKEFCKKKKN